jgi:hypothetical protein
MNRNTLLVVLTIALAVAASACSSSSPTITISTPPPASLEINGSASIAATTTHDSGEGVDWSCAPAGSCGTLNPTHTASGASTVYTAPSASGTVTITAASTKKASVTATATVTINPVATVSDLTGTYTFFANGYDINGAPVSVAGSIALDGAGNVTGGEQDEFDLSAVTPIATADPIMPASGAYTVGDDGRGSLAITPTTATPYTLSFAVVNSDHALIIQFDDNATTAGSLDLQTSTAVPANGGYSFASLDSADAFVFGGVVTSDGTSTFTDPSDADDDFQGTAFIDFDASGGGFSPTDASGRGTLTLFDETFGSTLQFAYYVVGPEAFRIVQIDGNTFLAGSMYGQGSTSGAFTTASLGTVVFGQAGQTDQGLGFYSAAGQFATDGTSAFSTGVADANLGDGTPVLAGDLTAGTLYSVFTDGYTGIVLGADLDATVPTLQNFGAYLVDPALNVTDPNNTSGGGGGLMLDLDGDSLGAGFVTPQTAGGSFAGNFATQQDAIYNTGGFNLAYDLVGQFVSDGVSSFTGLVDQNDLFNTMLNPGVTISGTFTADAANPGRSTATVTVNGAATPAAISIYAASSSLQVHIDTDTTATTSGSPPVTVFTGTIALGVNEQQQ